MKPKIHTIEWPDCPKGVWYLIGPDATGDIAEHPLVAPHLAKGEIVELISPR